MQRTRTIGTVTDDCYYTITQPGLLSSTPIKRVPDHSQLTPCKTDSSFASDDDSKDLTFVIENIENEDDDMEQSDTVDNGLEGTTYRSRIVDEPKIIVFESKRNELLNSLTCSECLCPVEPSDTVKEYIGSAIKVSLYCTSGHLIRKWNAQPVIGKMPAGNLLISASTLFCGQTYTHMSQFANFMNLKFIGKTTFQTIQRDIVMPVVDHSWLMMQDHMFEKIKSNNRRLRLAGDGRCDSPGFSAKYCTYSLMDMETQQILAFVNVQVSETGSSSKMEVEGFRRCMEFLLNKGFVIEVLATDRHVQIRSMMSKQFPGTEHQFDVWHLSNSVRKKLLKKSKYKGTEELGPWIKAICNHLWWCASHCEGNKVWLEESWCSIVNHVANQHTFDGDLVTRCAHGVLSNEQQRKKKWLKSDSKAHNAVKEVVLDKRLRKDIRQLSEFCHTGNLEVYHSLLTKYIPKRQEFDFDQMNCRTAIAVIDHNMSQNRPQKVDSQGNPVFKHQYSKGSSQWVQKAMYTPKVYQWVPVMMKMCVSQKENMLLSPVPVKPRGNIAPVPAPPRDDMMSNLISRFRKAYDSYVTTSPL